jgi:hypothetical protein
MIKTNASIMMVLLVASSLSAAEKSNVGRRRYIACEGNELVTEAAKIDWGQQKSKFDEHKKLREELHALIPDASSRISLYELGGDLATTYRSVVATRDKDGRWKIDTVGKSKIWIETATPSIFPQTQITLDQVKNLKLEKLLGDKCLYASPTNFVSSKIGVGTLGKVMEIETPKRHFTVSWQGKATRRVAELADILDGF